MIDRESNRAAYLASLVEATAVFLFFYQALRVLFSVLFGSIYDALFASTAPMSIVGLQVSLVFLAFLTPLFTSRRPGAWRITLLAGAVPVFVARILLTLNEPQVRFWAATAIVAGTGVYLVAQLRTPGRDLPGALLLALILYQLLRTAGHTLDVTLRPGWFVGQAIVSLGLCLLAVGLYRKRQESEADARTPLGLVEGLAWGGWLFLETTLLAFPNALARWSGTPYTVVAPLLVGVTFLMLLEGGRWTAGWGRPGRMISAALLLTGLAGGYLLTGPAALACLLLAQMAALSLLPVCFPPPQEGQEDRSGQALATGGAVYMILNFAYAFAFTYAYTLDLFRDTGLPLFLIAGLLASLPVLRRPVQAKAPTRLVAGRWMALWGIALVAIVTVLAWPAATRPLAAEDDLRPATYNIHYGYDSDWHLSLEAQAQAIEASGADVVALQEVDTGRPTSYMVDNALWLSRRLGMEVVYLPCVEHLSGIALLSRYPVLASEGILLPSELEQTGIIWAELDLGDRPVNAFAIWMGLEPDERARQLDAALPFVDAHPGPAVWGGDFNSTPESPVYARIAGAGFVDPFPTLGLGSPPTSPAISPLKRIDFVWLRGLEPVDAQVPGSMASDHRMVIVEASLP